MALAQNEQIKSNTDMMKKCKSLLVQEFSKVFPEDTAKYSGIGKGLFSFLSKYFVQSGHVFESSVGHGD